MYNEKGTRSDSPEIVAEMTTNHLGNLNLLLRMVDAAAEAGADSLKMQKKDVDTFYSKDKLERPFDSPYGNTYGDYRRMFEFGNHADWERLDERCTARKVPWFCTVQDERSLGPQILDHNDWQSHRLRLKVASSNARNLEFLQVLTQMAGAEYEIVLSVGGSTLTEIKAALDLLVPSFRRVWLLHCVAEYPTPPERARLGNIPELKRLFGSDRIRIGYSGHEEGIDATLAAVYLGAEMIERHFCLSRHSFAHHIECSLEPDEFAMMVELIKGPPDLLHRYTPTQPCPSHRVDFGMSDQERPFLVEQTYGNQFLGTESRYRKL